MRHVVFFSTIFFYFSMHAFAQEFSASDLLQNSNRVKISKAHFLKYDTPYVTAELLGGLGNLFFQIATVSSIAWDNGAAAIFPELQWNYYYRDILFRCNARNLPASPTFTYKCSDFEYDQIPFQPNMRISGYCQNQHYFAHHRERLLELFAPSRSTQYYLKKKYREILEHPQSVGVHLRYYERELPDEESGFFQYEREYFEKAMNLFPSNSLFIVVSDNIEFAKTQIDLPNRNTIFISGEKFFIDFFILSSCKHQIISNSSFSWWAAWLNPNPQKTVVMPKRWLLHHLDMNAPDDWIRIDAKSMREKKDI